MRKSPSTVVASASCIARRWCERDHASYASLWHSLHAPAPTYPFTAVCAGVPIYPGDLVVADDDGVFAVPLAAASDVLSRARARAERERENAIVLASGVTPFELHRMGEALGSSGTEVVDGSYPDV